MGKVDDLVSVIIPFYNIADKIDIFKNALQSVVKQTYRPLELVLINDGSIDKTNELVQELLQGNLMPEDIKVQYESLAVNSGTSIARNKGVRVSNGQYILFLDFDDVYFPDYIGKVKSHFTSFPDIDVIMSNAYFYVEWLNSVKVYSYSIIPTLNQLTWEELVLYFVTNNFPFPLGSALACRREVFSKILFSEFLSKKTVEDVDFGYRLLLNGIRPYFLEQPLVIHRTFLQFQSRSRSSTLRLDEYEINNYLLKKSRIPLLGTLRNEIGEKNFVEAKKILKLQKEILVFQSMFYKRQLVKSFFKVLFLPKMYKHWLRYFLLYSTLNNKATSYLYNWLLFTRTDNVSEDKQKVLEYLETF